MPRNVPPVSTDQVLAFVELVRAGNLHLAAQGLHLSDEGLRGRVIALERRLGVELYRKARGRRGTVDLTPAGRAFLPKAARFLGHASDLANLFDSGRETRDLHLLSSHYLTGFVLIDIVQAFRQKHPQAAIRLSTLPESQILATLLEDPTAAIGVCAPHEYPRGLTYLRWFAMAWSLVVPRGHTLAKLTSVPLADLIGEPLIVFEHASTGRQHVLEAFHAAGVEPRVAMEATTTQLIVSMVAAGLGVAVLPLLPSGKVTRDMPVVVVPIREPIREIESGVFVRADFEHDPLARKLVQMILATQP